MQDTNRQLIIDANETEVRIALLENNQLLELQIERKNSCSILGNIYKGRVARILPGMQSAFIEIGQGKSAFLFAGDINDDISNSNKGQSIDKILNTGDQIVVQVIKDSLGSKGPRVTTFISLANNFLVLTPNLEQIAISRRIEDSQRGPLESVLNRIKPPKMGLIARTAALQASEDLLKEELGSLMQSYLDYSQKIATTIAPSLLFQDNSLVMKSIQDRFSQGISSIIVNDPILFKNLSKTIVPNSSYQNTTLILHDEKTLIFDFYRIEGEFEKCLSNKVWLNSGAYLAIDQTEALITFDVNTGRFHGKKELEDNILQINLEAANEIAKQIRRRNLGGIIVIDFIDMEQETNREAVTKYFTSCLETDKARSKILSINDFGLLQMTRKRTSDSIGRILTDPCGLCHGTGREKNLSTLSHELIRELKRAAYSKSGNSAKISISRDLYEYLVTEESSIFEYFNQHFKLTFDFFPALKTEPFSKYQVEFAEQL